MSPFWAPSGAPRGPRRGAPPTPKEYGARTWIFVALTLVLVALGALSMTRRIVAETPTTGVEWIQASAGPLAMAVEEGSPAWRAGLRAGDLLREIDGRPVRSALDAAELGWEAGGGPIRLTTRRGSTDRALTLTPEWQEASDIYIYLLIVGLAFLVSGVFIALRWTNIRGGVLYSYLSLSLFALLTFSHTGRGDAVDWVIHWIDLAAAAIVPALLLHVSIALVKQKFSRRRPYLAVAYSVSAGLLLSAIWLSPGGQGGAYRFESPLLALEVRDRLEGG